MVVRLVARVKLSDMSSTVLYPREEVDEERIALLTGIIQLVSAALEKSGSLQSRAGELRYMKSDRGVIGYCSAGGDVLICEGDAENETGETLKALVKSPDASVEQLKLRIQKTAKTRAKEIGDLWK